MGTLGKSHFEQIFRISKKWISNETPKLHLEEFISAPLQIQRVFFPPAKIVY